MIKIKYKYRPKGELKWIEHVYYARSLNEWQKFCSLNPEYEYEIIDIEEST